MVDDDKRVEDMRKIFKLALSVVLASSLAFCTFGCTNNGDKNLGNDVESGEGTTPENPEPPEQGGETEPTTPEQPEQGGETEPSTPETPDTPENSDNPETPEQGQTELTYNQKMERCLDGTASTAFTTFVSSLAQYDYSAPIAAGAIYASPNGNGDGTLNDPYSLQDGLDELKPGGTLYLRGGTYSTSDKDGFFINCKGTAANYVTIRNYPGEKAVIENTYRGSESYGFQFEKGAEYIIFEGIEICSVQSKCAYGIVFWGDGQNNVVIRNCDIHDIKTTSANPEKDSDAGANAILLFGEKTAPIADIAIIDNHCYNNVNGWSENISVTANCERVYVLGNLVENNTNIGIDFYGNAGYCDIASLDQPRNCLAAGNVVKNCVCSYADCAGLYVDGSRDIILQNNFISDCAYGIEVGSEERNDSYPVKNILVRSNICKGNSVTGIRVGGYEEVETGTVQATYICNNTLSGNGVDGGAAIIIAKVDGVSFINNVICAEAGLTLISTDFGEAYTQNLSFSNNLFYVSGSDGGDVKFEICGNSIVGFSAFNSLYGGTNIYGDPKLDGEYVPTNGSPCIGAGDNTANFGKYDYYLKEWGVPDIGAVKG
ncbi:MAG: hypothetical protein ACI4MB_06740 [Candidatus Coproplasma sp.]